MASKYPLRTRNRPTVLDNNLDESVDSSDSDADEPVPSKKSVRKRPNKTKFHNIKEQKVDGTALDHLRDLEDAIDAVAQSYFAGGKKERKGQEESKPENLAIPLDSLNECLVNADSNLPPSAAKLLEKHNDLFPEYMVYLCEGFNLLFYGFGSKESLLDEFAKEQLLENDYCHFVIRGYSSSVTIKQILSSLISQLSLKLSTTTSNSVELAHCIKAELESNVDAIGDVVLVLHNIDGPSLRDDNSQTALSILATASNLHLVASIDHVNASLLWDQAKLSRFRWVWLDGTTYKCYRSELLAGESKLLGLGSRSAAVTHTLASLDSVWASLTQNTRKIFVAFARCCLSTKNAENGISFWELYRVCKDDFLVSSETALQQQLVEFQDHHLMCTKRMPNIGQFLTLTVEKQVLGRFLLTQGEDILEDDDD